jgi:hypothetical protein
VLGSILPRLTRYPELGNFILIGESLAKWLDSMLKHRVITLDTEGAFVAPVADAMCHLIFDGDADHVRWILIDVPTNGRPESFLSIHHDLDEGLRALATVAGWGGQRFRVEVGGDKGFIRPGRVPASEILAGMGYILVRSVVCYAMIEPSGVIDAEEARSEFVRRLAGRGLTVGAVDPVGPPDMTWCADVTIPYEGFIYHGDVPGLIDHFTEGSGLEISEHDECNIVDFATPHVPVVTPFPVAA